MIILNNHVHLKLILLTLNQQIGNDSRIISKYLLSSLYIFEVMA